MYNHNEVCEWVIQFPIGKQISLVTKSFSLENDGSLCRYDFLEIRDGETKYSPLFGKFCGSAKPPHFISTGNYLYIKFKSDYSFADNGFQLEYSDAPISKIMFFI